MAIKFAGYALLGASGGFAAQVLGGQFHPSTIIPIACLLLAGAALSNA